MLLSGARIGVGILAATAAIAYAFYQLRKGATRLHRACTKGDVGFVKAAVTRSPWPVERRDLFGLRPLQYAAEAGNAQVVSDLLDAGASATAGTPWPPLFLASPSGDKETVAVLLRHLSQHDPGGLTERVVGHALCAAATHNHIHVLEVYRDRGFPIDSCHEGSTALHAAAYEGHVAAVRWLLDHGADASKKDARGKLARSIAASELHDEIVRLFDEEHRQAGQAGRNRFDRSLFA